MGSLSAAIDRLIKAFDIKAYLKQFAPLAPYPAKDEWRTHCPWCAKGRMLLGINITSGYWHCFRCDRGSKNFVHLMMVMERISYRQALEKLQAGAVTPSTSDLSFVKIILDNVEGLDNDRVAIPETIPLPEDYISLEGKEHWYTRKRRMSQESVDRQQLGYCETGIYSGYLIVPDLNEDEEVVYWLARRMGEGHPKTKNPPKEWAKVGSADRLFNYHRAIYKPQAVITEGWADALRVGDDGVATYGAGLKASQIGLLVQGGFDKIILMYDGDAAGREATADDVQKLTALFNVYTVNLPEGDPDDYNSRVLRGIINNAKPAGGFIESVNLFKIS